MPAGDLASKSIHELIALRDAGKISPEEIVSDVVGAIERLNPAYHAYLPFDRAAVQRRLREAPKGPLHGIPITVKDNICVTGEETACASKILAGFKAPYDATVIAKLKRAGAVIVPRANMDEFAFGSSTENSAFGPTRNPWDVSRVPGGSSGGSAAAVAGRLAVAALGSDTGGSIRQPASFCGITGLKPTYGRVSRYGLVAFASSLDQIGPLTRDAEDAALLLSTIAGHDPNDSTSAPVDVPNYAASLTQGAKGLRIGVPVLPKEGLSAEVGDAVERAVDALKQAGCSTVSVQLPHLDKSVETYYITATAEASSNLARFDGVRYGARRGGEGGDQPLLDLYLRTRTEGFGAEAKRRILLGTYVLSHGYYDAYYLKGMKVRTIIKQGFDAAFTACDLVVMPTAPTPAFTIGEKLSDPLQMYLSDIYTISANLAGIPAISIPCGFSKDGLPIGLQLLAKPFAEETLFRAAHAYEQATDWRTRAPKAP